MVVLSILVLLIQYLCSIQGENTEVAFITPDNVVESVGFTEVCVRISQSGDVPMDTFVTVDAVLNGNPNQAGTSDFSPQSMVLMFTEDEVRDRTPPKCVNVTIVDDDVAEANEVVEYTINSTVPSSVEVSTSFSSADFLIVDSDIPTFSMTNETLSVSESGVFLSVCMTLEGPSGGLDRDQDAQTILIPGSAQFPRDFVITPSLPFAVMFTGGKVVGDMACNTIEIENDEIFDGDRQFQLMLEDIEGYMVIPPLTTTITIEDDDSAPLTVTRVEALVEEGMSFMVCVRLGSVLAPVPIEVNLTITGETIDDDFVIPFPFQVVIAVNTDEECLQVDVTMDNLLEGNETFNISILSSDPPLTIDTPPATSTVIDIDSVNVTFVVSENSFLENSVTNMVCIAIGGLPSEGTAVPVFVFVDAVNPNVERCNAERYARTPEDLTTDPNVIFPPTTIPLIECLNITIVDDTFAEYNEIFELEITETSPSNAIAQYITETQVIIEDNDVVIFAVPESDSILESDTPFYLNISVSGSATDLERDIVITVEDVPGSAQDPADYQFSPVDLFFNCSDSMDHRLGRVVSVPIMNDLLLEGNEEFALTITSSSTENVIIDSNMINVTITDDEFSAGFYMVEVTVLEEDTNLQLEFVVFEGLPARETVFDISFVEDSAISGDDFMLLTTRIVLDSWTTRAFVNITIKNDNLTEPNELFQVIASVSDLSVTLVNYTVNVTIDSEDTSTVSLRVISSNVTEGEAVEVCIFVEGSQLGYDLSVDLITTNITAMFNVDYVAALSSGFTVVIAAFTNETCSDLITAINDNIFEASETFEISIESDSLDDVTNSMSIAANVSIININVFSITIQPMMSSISEVDGRTNITAEVIADIDVAVDVVLTLDFAMSNATLNEDFSVSGIEFIFPSQFYFTGDSQVITVIGINDQILEGNEAIIFELVTDVTVLPGLNVIVASDTITILDDEVIVIGFVNDTVNVIEEVGMVDVCITPVSVPAEGFSIPIQVSVSVVPNSVDDDTCSGSGLATENSDFVVSGTIMFTFPPNSTNEECVTVLIADDAIAEDNETFSLQINILSPAIIVNAGDPLAFTIYDNDNIVVRMSNDSVTVNENVGIVSVCSEVVEGFLCADTSIDVEIMDGTASNGDDFVIDSQSISYFSNSTVGSSSCLNATIIDDMDVEQAIESFQLTLSSSTNRLVEILMLYDTTVININENDAAVAFSNQSLFVFENEPVTICAEIVAGQLLKETTVHVNVTRTETSAGDLSFSTTYFIFGPDTFIDCIVLSITADVIKEINETISLQLYEMEPTVVASDDILNITIVSNDVAVVSFVNDTVIYVDESISEVSLCVELTGAALSQDLTVQLQHAAVAPVVSLGDDYTIPWPFAVTFSAGSPIGSQECITIGIVNDESFEGTHDFSVSLVDPNNPLCEIGTSSEVQIIILDNEEVTISLVMSNLTITEQASENLLIELSDVPAGGTAIPIVVDLFVSPGTGEDNDVSLSQTTVTFVPGAMSTETRSVTVTAVDDSFIENKEQLTISINDTGAIFTVASPSNATITILNINNGSVEFDVLSQTSAETNGTVSICVEFSFGFPTTLLEDDLTIYLNFSDISTTVNQDYSIVTSSVTFLAMSLSGSVNCASVAIIADDLFEDTMETFNVFLNGSSIDEITVSSMPQLNTITDNDDAVFNVSEGVAVLEDGDSATVCINLTAPANGLGIEVMLVATTFNGDAIDTIDYTAINQLVTFEIGSQVRCIDIPIIDDLLIEGNEEFTVSVRQELDPRIIINPENVTVTIIDNDLRVVFLNESSAFIFSEMDAPTFTVCFEVEQGVPSFDNEVFLSPDSTATALIESDYILNGSPFVLNSTVTSGCIDVVVLDDDFFENENSVSFMLDSTSSGLQIVNGFLNLTIENDDFPEFEFNNTKYIVNETSNTEVCIRTVPGGDRVGPDVPMTVVLSVRNRTALEFFDFSFDLGLELTFTGSSSVVCTPVTIIDDGLVEYSEYFLVSFEHQGSSGEVEVIIHDPDVCPNVETGPVCEDSIFLRVCNSLQDMGRAVPRPCSIVLEEYTDINYQP